MTDRTKIVRATKFGETSGLTGGETIYVTYEGVTATATFISGMQGKGDMKMVMLHGTDQTINVPGWTITKEQPK